MQRARLIRAAHRLKESRAGQVAQGLSLQVRSLGQKAGLLAAEARALRAEGREVRMPASAGIGERRFSLHQRAFEYSAACEILGEHCAREFVRFDTEREFREAELMKASKKWDMLRKQGEKIEFRIQQFAKSAATGLDILQSLESEESSTLSKL